MSTKRSADTASAVPPVSAVIVKALLAKPVLRISEVETVTGASRSTIVRAIAAGELPATKVGRAVYLPTESTLAFFGAETQGKAA